jgi:hypothetical protein
MTHQGHSATTFTCGFTHPGGNDSGKLLRSCRQSGNDAPQESHPHLYQKKRITLNIARLGTRADKPGHWVIPVARRVVTDKS